MEAVAGVVVPMVPATTAGKVKTGETTVRGIATAGAVETEAAGTDGLPLAPGHTHPHPEVLPKAASKDALRKWSAG